MKRKSPDWMKATKIYVKKEKKQKWTSHAQIQKRIDDLDENTRKNVISGEERLACNHSKRLIRTYAEDQIRRCSERFERDWIRWEPELREAWMESNQSSKRFGLEWHSSCLNNESKFILPCCWSKCQKRRGVLACYNSQLILTTTKASTTWA